VPDHFLARGRYSATTDEIGTLVGLPHKHLYSGLKRLRDRQLAFSPARGLYFFVPPEYRAWGVVPGTWFIDDAMRHLGRAYHVGLLSAAELHGAAHHAPQVFQVVVDRHLANRDLGRVRVRFIRDADARDALTVVRTVPTGTVTVASREQTAAELVGHPRLAGGWDNIATVIAALGALDGQRLAEIVRSRPVAHARRLGWMLDRFGDDVDTAALEELARRPSAPPTLLEPSGPRDGDVDRRWALILNTDVSPDL
jgi:predicted transcriptional regulator of viral defense system